MNHLVGLSRVAAFGACLLIIAAIVLRAAGVGNVRPVGSKEAVKIGSAFLNIGAAGNMKYKARAMRKDYPPLRMCHVLELALGVTSESGRLLKAQTWVEEDTGRVLAYLPDASYKRLKNKRKPLVAKSDIIPKEKAQKLAEAYLQRAGVSVDGMRVTDFWLDGPRNDNNYYGYSCIFTRFSDTAGIGEVELPETAVFRLDAVTGEVDEYFYKNYPVTVQLAPPTVSESRAEALALECCKPGDVESITTNLMVFPGNGPKYDRQALAWHVVFKEKGVSGGSPLPVIIDAHTAAVLSCARLDRGR